MENDSAVEGGRGDGNWKDIHNFRIPTSYTLARLQQHCHRLSQTELIKRCPLLHQTCPNVLPSMAEKMKHRQHQPKNKISTPGVVFEQRYDEIHTRVPLIPVSASQDGATAAIKLAAGSWGRCPDPYGKSERGL